MSPPPEPGRTPTWRSLLHAGLWLAVVAPPVGAQAPPDLIAERRAFSDWLGRAPTSPTALIARSPIGAGLSIGPATADLPLDGVTGQVEEKSGRVVFTDAGGSRTVPVTGTLRIGQYLFSAAGPRGRTVLLVYGDAHRPATPSWYPYDPALSFTVELRGPAIPPPRPRLDGDGIEVEALEVGRVTVPLGPSTSELTVYEMGGGDDEEAPELTVYFQDRTNAHGSYPAGRFVALTPAAAGRYRLDFNRARNPYCAYSTIYPCPAPWPGNLIDAPVPAGERYVSPAGEQSH
jgi:hypothetical protein